MNPEKFLDTSYVIALSSSTDDYHHKALVIAQQLKASKTPLVTTRAIILEIGNALSKQKYRSKSIKLLSSLEKDKTVTVIPLSETLYQKAFQLYCQRNDSFDFKDDGQPLSFSVCASKPTPLSEDVAGYVERGASHLSGECEVLCQTF
jgi:predicted nucleic acid-binding protein